MENLLKELNLSNMAKPYTEPIEVLKLYHQKLVKCIETYQDRPYLIDNKNEKEFECDLDIIEQIRYLIHFEKNLCTMIGDKYENHCKRYYNDFKQNSIFTDQYF